MFYQAAARKMMLPFGLSPAFAAAAQRYQKEEGKQGPPEQAHEFPPRLEMEEEDNHNEFPPVKCLSVHKSDNFRRSQADKSRN